MISGNKLNWFLRQIAMLLTGTVMQKRRWCIRYRHRGLSELIS